jgi:internalin A
MSRLVALAFAGVVSVVAAGCNDPTGLGSGAYCEVRPDTAVVSIQDPDLDFAIHAALGVSALLPLTCGMVESLTGLNASSRGITSLEGIENLSGLTTLTIRDNAITDIGPLRALTGLTFLNLAANDISDVEPLRRLTALTFLAINDNGAIRDIDALSALTSLSGTLWLGGNAIESLEPLRGLADVTAIRAWHNRIADLAPLAGLTGLSEVNVHHNALTSARGLSTLPALQSVWLHSNPQLVDIQDLIDNAALGFGTDVNVSSTGVSCADVEALTARGVAVISDCP